MDFFSRNLDLAYLIVFSDTVHVKIIIRTFDSVTNRSCCTDCIL